MKGGKLQGPKPCACGSVLTWPREDPEIGEFPPGHQLIGTFRRILGTIRLRPITGLWRELSVSGRILNPPFGISWFLPEERVQKMRFPPRGVWSTSSSGLNAGPTTVTYFFIATRCACRFEYLCASCCWIATVDDALVVTGTA